MCVFEGDIHLEIACISFGHQSLDLDKNKYPHGHEPIISSCPSLISIANLKVCSKMGFIDNTFTNLPIIKISSRNPKSTKFNTFVLNLVIL